MTKIKTLWNYLVGLASIAAFTSTLMFPLTASAGAILYGATGSQGATSVLYQIDKTTGVGTAIGSIGFNVSGIAFDPTTGILYGLSGRVDAGPAELVTINTTTGAGTLVGTVTGAVTDAFPDITFDAAGNLYAWTQNGDRLVKIDKATAAVTFVGPSIATQRTALAFSHAGTLYLEDFGRLRTIDPITGAVIATISSICCSVGVGMDFDENDVLYAIELVGGGSTGARNLVTVNTVNGAIATIGATVAGLEALAFETNPPMESTLAFLHGSGANANPAVLFLDSEAPTSSTAKHKDSAAIKFSGGNPWKLIGTWTAEPEFFIGSLTALSDLRVWLGLKNSDDQGTRFDLAAEVWKNGDLVAEGETLCITGVTRNPALAKEVTVTFQPFSPVTFNGSSDVLSLKLFTRIGTNGSGGFCGGHGNAAGLRLYFDAADRDAEFSVNLNSAGDSGWIDWINKSTTSVSGHIPNTQITATITAESPTAEDMSLSVIDDTFNWVAAWFTPNLSNSDAIRISNSIANSNDLWRIQFSQPVTNPQIHFRGMERTYSFNSNIELVSAGSSFVVVGSTIEGIRGCDSGEPKSGTLRMPGTFIEITIQGSGIAECGHNRDGVEIQVGVNIP